MPPALTLENIRRYWFYLEQIYTPLGDAAPSGASVNWVARIAAIRAHYRQTYQLPRPWMRRVLDLRPYRVGILDPFTGTKAPSQAWSQYCVEPTSKFYFQAKYARDRQRAFYWLNVDDYPGYSNDPEDPSDPKRPSPASVHIVDSDLGVIRIDYRLDPHGMRSQIHPSQMAKYGSGEITAPSRDLKEQLSRVMITDGQVEGAAPIALSDDFRVAVIFTAMPGAPNNETRFYRHTVYPDDVKQSLSPTFQVANGTGPTWHVMIPPSIVTAWYAWTKTAQARQTAPNLFGFRGGTLGNPDSDLETAPTDHQGFTIVNEDSLLPALCNAYALSMWSAFLNHREGMKVATWSPGTRIKGNIGSVAHSLSPDGRMTTAVGMLPGVNPIPVAALIPREARPVLLRQITEMPG